MAKDAVHGNDLGGRLVSLGLRFLLRIALSRNSQTRWTCTTHSRKTSTHPSAANGTRIRCVTLHDLRIVHAHTSDVTHQGTLMLTVRGAQSSVLDAEIWDRFGAFGELKAVVSGPEMRRDERRIEYWDSRVRLSDCHQSVQP